MMLGMRPRKNFLLHPYVDQERDFFIVQQKALLHYLGGFNDKEIFRRVGPAILSDRLRQGLLLPFRRHVY
jgi:hypothetical protein